MKKRILITGGAGFIGSHLADELLAHGYTVKVFDNLLEQVHGYSGEKPRYLSSDVEFINGDVRDKTTLRKALRGVDAVYHLAARVGARHSMFALRDYTEVNCAGTAQLLESLIENPVEKLIVASSMSIYGEGLYQSPSGTPVENVNRHSDQLKKGLWDVYNNSTTKLTPVATPEWKCPKFTSIYALGKYEQEQMCLIAGNAYGIKTTALRFFNVYGSRQTLSNPYSGILANFASRFLNDQAPLIFEDGGQLRDFICVYDAVRACRLALETDKSIGQVFNIGTGRSFSVLEIARKLGKSLGKSDIHPDITTEYRKGDIRHCYADITKARQLIGFYPTIALEDGLRELAGWFTNQAPLKRAGKVGSTIPQRIPTLNGQRLTQIQHP